MCCMVVQSVCVCFRLSLYVLYGSTECVCVSGLSLYVPYGSTECVCVSGCLCMCRMVVQRVCVCVSGCLCMCCMVVQRVCVFQVVSVCAVW